MDQVAPVWRRFPPSGYRGDDDHACQSPKPAVRATVSDPPPFILKTSLVIVFIVVFLTTTHFRVISAQAVANFSVDGTSYNCSSNIICLGEAHRYEEDSNSDNINIASGSLTLVREKYDYGIAYYWQPVKLLDLSTNQSASFSTNFTIDKRAPAGALEQSGDGMTFLLSANNSYEGSLGGFLGIFNNLSYSTPFKSIVVEFDIYRNNQYPEFDISGNHLSFDFGNITAAKYVDLDSTSITLYDNLTKYAWVDYNRDTLQLEVRVSYDTSKPLMPLLNYTMNLTDFVEEEMWVGFSGSSGASYSNYYIGNWIFDSWGIPAPSPSPAPTVPSSPPPKLSSPSPTGQKSGGNKLGLIVGISVGVVFLLVCVTIIAFFARRRTWSGGIRQLGRPAITEEDLAFQILEGMPERFSYKQLSVATRGFSEETKLGQGGFGNVYRGVLPSSGIPVAVKKINSDSNQGEKEFMAEVSIISRLRHRNLIQLQGWCKDASRGKYLLVYELMPNGSLDKALFQAPESQAACLSWAQRFNIVTGTAAAIDYLHQGWKQQVIHRDIKSSNIMLDEDWNAKLGDFGLARLVDHTREAATTVVAGTYGFIAPEAASRGRFTDKTDVFAFGAVVLEIACGRSAFSTKFPPEEMFLVDWVWQRLSEGALLTTVDKQLADYDTYSMEVVLIIGLLCSHPNPLARPSMRQVVQVLAGEAPVPSIPASKPTPFNSEIDPEVISMDFLHGSRSGSSSKSRSGSMSLVSLSNSNPSRGSTVKSSNGTSSSKSSTSLKSGAEVLPR